MIDDGLGSNAITGINAFGNLYAVVENPQLNLYHMTFVCKKGQVQIISYDRDFQLFPDFIKFVHGHIVRNP